AADDGPRVVFNLKPPSFKWASSDDDYDDMSDGDAADGETTGDKTTDDKTTDGEDKENIPP
ncbi:MAG: hypothetical protein GY738_01105, partial [Pseudoalteromonas sp.]|nr:hypothetical protein [Pseudoalteromonas sp.]